MTAHEADMQRAIGRIEGTQTQILAKLDAMIVTHIQHENDDRRDFAGIRVLFDKKMDDQNSTRETQLSEMDVKLDALKQDQDRAKGAGWVILGLIASLATFVGGTVIEVVRGHLKWGP